MCCSAETSQPEAVSCGVGHAGTAAGEEVLEADQPGPSHHHGAHHRQCVSCPYLWLHLQPHEAVSDRHPGPPGSPPGLIPPFCTGVAVTPSLCFAVPAYIALLQCLHVLHLSNTPGAFPHLEAY